MVPWVGKCWQNGWMRLVEVGNLTCKKEPRSLRGVLGGTWLGLSIALGRLVGWVVMLGNE